MEVAMPCDKVLRLLSPYIDDVLNNDEAVEVSQHLNHCINCRKELNHLSLLRRELKSLSRIEAPEYVHHLVQIRLADIQKNTWRTSLRDALEYRWAKIRTTEGRWYITRVLGTVATCIFFFLISNAIHPVYLDIHSPFLDRGIFSPVYKQQLGISVLKRLGLAPLEAPKKNSTRSQPMINDQYLSDFSQSVSHVGNDDNLSVLAAVDRSGAAKVEDVLEYPEDQTFMSNIIEGINSSRCRPASENGRTVVSHLVLIFNKIHVYDY